MRGLRQPPSARPEEASEFFAGIHLRSVHVAVSAMSCHSCPRCGPPNRASEIPFYLEEFCTISQLESGRRAGSPTAPRPHKFILECGGSTPLWTARLDAPPPESSIFGKVHERKWRLDRPRVCRFGLASACPQILSLDRAFGAARRAAPSKAASSRRTP